MSRGERVRFVFDPAFQTYDFGSEHPLRPERTLLLADLLAEAGLWQTDGAEHMRPVPATDEELRLVHTDAYIRTVKELSAPGSAPPWYGREHGFGPGDNPPFPGMHEASALVAGGSLQAARAIMRGEIDHAFNAAGGLHHGMPDRASGFCIYDDPAIAIADAVREGARVFYVDFDAHHGDGVQWIFYEDPRVFTLSFHESGRYLFPGTGDVTELGHGPGFGYAVNVPVQPYTQDESWLECVRTVLPPLVARFRPDLIVSVHGCDTHRWDPLTHLALSVEAMREQARLVHELAHAHCGGRWLALGAGGYDPYRVNSRGWGLLWAEMAGRAVPERLPESWRERWQAGCPERLPETWLDQPEWHPPMPRKAAIESENRATVRRLAPLLFQA